MLKKSLIITSISCITLVLSGCSTTASGNLPGKKIAKGKRGSNGAPPTRKHTALTTGEVVLLSANNTLSIESEISVSINGNVRSINSNGIPNHKVGRFPNSGNPNSIKARNYQFKMTTNPAQTGSITPSDRWYWGVAVNGVPFEAQTAEFWQGKRGGWNYDALGGALPLGLDANNAHVQPTGAYHYHGLPIGLMQALNWQANEHSPQLGWAADGYPVYALTGDLGNGVTMLTSSYQLKEGNRPGGSNNPSGRYDGTFNQDWEYVEGSGDLDECNGAVTYSNEFPNGTYAYFMTKDHPFLSRCWTGKPDRSFFTNH